MAPPSLALKWKGCFLAGLKDSAGNFLPPPFDSPPKTLLSLLLSASAVAGRASLEEVSRAVKKLERLEREETVAAVVAVVVGEAVVAVFLLRVRL